MTCEVCGSKKCKRQEAVDSLAEREAALKASRAADPFGRNRRLEMLFDNARLRLRREQRDCDRRAFVREHNGKCPLCLRPIAVDAAAPPKEGECGIIGKAVWSWHSAATSGSQSACLSLAWDRLMPLTR